MREECPHCGAELPRDAVACPECGSCEETGWSERAHADNLGLPDEDFDYDEFVKEEFGGGGGSGRSGGKTFGWFWWIVATLLLLSFLAFVI